MYQGDPSKFRCDEGQGGTCAVQLGMITFVLAVLLLIKKQWYPAFFIVFVVLFVAQQFQKRSITFVELAYKIILHPEHIHVKRQYEWDQLVSVDRVIGLPNEIRSVLLVLKRKNKPKELKIRLVVTELEIQRIEEILKSKVPEIKLGTVKSAKLRHDEAQEKEIIRYYRKD